MNALPAAQFDDEGVRRIAQVLLRHVRPQDRNTAYEVLDGRLGVYLKNRTVIRAEVDRYFNHDQPKAA